MFSHHEAPLPKLRQRTQVKDGLAAKKVKFVDPTAADEQVRFVHQRLVTEAHACPILCCLFLW